MPHVYKSWKYLHYAQNAIIPKRASCGTKKRVVPPFGSWPLFLVLFKLEISAALNGSNCRIPDQSFHFSLPHIVGVIRRQSTLLPVYIVGVIRRQSMARTYECTDCPLNGGETHRVNSSDTNHQVQVALLRNRGNATASLQSPPDLDGLSDLLMGIVLTDDGPNPREQPSKFFTTREEFQDLGAGSIPTSVNPVPFSVAQPSFYSVLHSTQYMGWRSVPRNEQLLTDIRTQVRVARDSLDGIDQLYAENNDHLSMSLAVEAATEVVTSSARRLRSVTTSAGDALAQLKNEVLMELRELDMRIDALGAMLPRITERAPLRYNSCKPVYLFIHLFLTHVSQAHVLINPVGHLDLVAQLMVLLAVVCNVVIGLSTNPCDLIIDTVQMIIRLVMSMNLPPDAHYDPHQTHVLKQLPTSLRAALNTFKLDTMTTVYATCPSCHFTHAPTENRITGDREYPDFCQNYILETHSRRPCSEPLLTLRHGKLRPIKPYIYVSFMDHLARLLSDPKIEEMCDRACDVATASIEQPAPVCVCNVFEAGFLRTFVGPDGKTLFIDRGGRMRLALEVLIDFFNPHGTSKRGNHDSIGIISVAVLNIDEDIRYKPENLWVSLIPGAKEPTVDGINHYTRPLVDECVVGWERGIHISSTTKSPSGRDVDLAVVISVNDLPAARKVSGSAGVGSNHYCTVCKCFGIATAHRTDFGHPDWSRRDINLLREKAYAWKNAQTQAERDQIFEEYGTRWSEYWRFVYWDPTRMLVIDGMHCVLEGLVHYHCRKVLRIDAEVVKRKERGPIAFHQDWVAYDPTQLAPKYLMNNPAKEEKQILLIQSRLVAPFVLEDNVEPNNPPIPHVDEDQEMPSASESPDDAPPESEIDQLHGVLSKRRLTPLRFVVYSLGLDTSGPKKKANYIAKLIAWVNTLIFFYFAFADYPIQRRTKPSSGFEHDWVQYDLDTHGKIAECELRTLDKDLADIPRIQASLTKSLVISGNADVGAVLEGDEEAAPQEPSADAGPDPQEPSADANPDPERSNVQDAAAALNEALKSHALTQALKSFNLPPLRYVAYSLGLDMSGPNNKQNWATKLTAWVSDLSTCNSASDVPFST